MAASALTEKLSAAGEPGQYGGAETVLRFSDPRAEFSALRSACGVYHLSWRSRILVQGKDRVRWMNNMVTNNVRDLPSGRGVYSFVLNVQGRILGDLYAYNRGEQFVVHTDAAQVENLLTLWRRFIIMDKVELVNAGSSLTTIGVHGPKAVSVLRAAGVGLPELEPLQIADSTSQFGSVTVVRGDWPTSPSYELWVAPEQAPAIWDALIRAGATPVGAESLELFRIANGVPKFGQDIRERDLPQETQQDRALNFTKGCYIGQEIVERIRSRGNVHRAFSGFRIEGPLPAPGAKLQTDGKDVGEITSSAMLPVEGGELPVALGYVRREVGSVGTVLSVGGANATVAELPFQEATV